MIVLGLDPSKSKSGAAIVIAPRELHAAARVKRQSQREFFVRTAVDLSLEFKLPLAIVAEDWDPPRNRRRRNAAGESLIMLDQKWTPSTVKGMGEGWGLWRAEILRYGLDPYVTRVTPNVWRDALFGKRRGKDTDSAKADAIFHVKTIFGVELDDDSSEAVCMALWGFKNKDVIDCARRNAKMRGWSPTKS